MAGLEPFEVAHEWTVQVSPGLFVSGTLRFHAEPIQDSLRTLGYSLKATNLDEVYAFLERLQVKS